MKLTQLVVAGAAFAMFGAIAAEEPKHKQDSQAQGRQSQGSEKQAQGGQKQQAGQSQETVKQAQEKLSSQGYDPGPIDGILGPKTQAAVKKLQEDRSLKPTGQLDQQTTAALGLEQGGSASTGASGRAGASSGGQSTPQSSEKPDSTEKKQ